MGIMKQENCTGLGGGPNAKQTQRRCRGTPRFRRPRHGFSLIAIVTFPAQGSCFEGLDDRTGGQGAGQRQRRSVEDSQLF